MSFDSMRFDRIITENKKKSDRQRDIISSYKKQTEQHSIHCTTMNSLFMVVNMLLKRLSEDIFKDEEKNI